MMLLDCRLTHKTPIIRILQSLDKLGGLSHAFPYCVAADEAVAPLQEQDADKGQQRCTRQELTQLTGSKQLT